MTSLPTNRYQTTSHVAPMGEVRDVVCVREVLQGA